MTVSRVCSIPFEPLVGFTNNFAQMSSMMRRCAVPIFNQGQFKVKIKVSVKTCSVCIFCTFVPGVHTNGLPSVRPSVRQSVSLSA